MKDKNGNVLKIGDIVHNCYGYDLIVCKDDDGHYYGKLLCEKGHLCEDISYALYSSEIELLHKQRIIKVTDIKFVVIMSREEANKIVDAVCKYFNIDICELT